jgi:hypothetical protein
VNFASLDKDLDLTGAGMKSKILRKLTDSKSKVRSFTASDFESDGCYIDFFKNQHEQLHQISAEVTLENPILKVTGLTNLRRLRLKFSVLAEYDADELAGFLHLPKLVHLSMETNVTEDSPKLLHALRKSKLPELQVLELTLERPRCLKETFPTVKYLKANSSALRAINLHDSFFPEKSDFLLTDIFQISFYDSEIKNWPQIDAISRSYCDMPIGSWFLNGEPIFSVLSTSLFVRYDEADQLSPLYASCFPDDQTLTLKTELIDEMRFRASEMSRFLSQLEYLDHKIHPSTISFLRSSLSRLIPASYGPSRRIKSGADVLNPVSSVIFKWCDDRLTAASEDMEPEREMIRAVIEIDSHNVAALLLNFPQLASWYFGDSIWNWEPFGSKNWSQEISDLVAMRLYQMLLEQESHPVAFQAAAAEIKRSFPHIPRRIELFVTGQDRRETGPLICRLRVREARKLLSEILPSPNRSNRM